MSMISWMNCNQGFVSAILALFTIIISSTAIVISILTTKAQNRINLLNDRIELIDVLELFNTATKHCLDKSDDGNFSSDDRFRAILFSVNGKRIAKELIDRLIALESSTNNPRMPKIDKTHEIDMLRADIFMQEFAYFNSQIKILNRAKYIFKTDLYKHIDLLSTAITDYLLTNSSEDHKKLELAYHNFSQANVIEEVVRETRIAL